MSTGLSLVKQVEPLAGDPAEPKAAKTPKNRVRDFLLWVGLMKTSTTTKDGETHTEYQWNIGAIVLILFLYVTVIGGFVILAIGGSLYFLEMREQQRNEEKWRQVKDYDALQREKKSCMENAETLAGLQRYFQQKGQEIPPQFLKVKECGKPDEDGH